MALLHLILLSLSVDGCGDLSPEPPDCEAGVLPLRATPEIESFLFV